MSGCALHRGPLPCPACNRGRPPTPEEMAELRRIVRDAQAATGAKEVTSP